MIATKTIKEIKIKKGLLQNKRIYIRNQQWHGNSNSTVKYHKGLIKGYSEATIPLRNIRTTHNAPPPDISVTGAQLLHCTKSKLSQLRPGKRKILAIRKEWTALSNTMLAL